MATREVSDSVIQAVERLKDLVAQKNTLTLVFEPCDSTSELYSSEKLPPSYRAFIAKFGFFYVEYVNECIKLFPPEQLSTAGMGDTEGNEDDIADAIAFQRIDDDAVDNFFCFNPRVDLGDGELPVVSAYHDESFSMDESDCGFEDHIVEVIDEFIETYSEV